MPNDQKNAPLDEQAGTKFEPEASIVIENLSHCKRLAELTVKAAMAGHLLTPCNDGYLLSRWSYSRHCNDLNEVEHLLNRMGGMGHANHT